MTTTRAWTILRLIAPLVPPLAAAGLQWMLWRLVSPLVWIFFYPAVFFSSWLGGLWGGLGATVVSIAFVSGIFLPAVHGFGTPRHLLSVGIFGIMGALFSLLHQRLRSVQRAMRASVAELDRAQTVAQTGSWHLDTGRNVLSWSDETHRIFGLPKGTLTYADFLARVHPDDRDAVDRCWKAALTGAPYDIVHRIVVDRQTKWVRERAELEFGSNHSVVGGVGTVQDVTAMKEAEAKLHAAHETERRLRAELEDVTLASSAVSDAVAQLPRADLAAVLHMIALQAQSLANAEYVALGVGTDPDRPFDPWVFVGVSGEVADAIGRHPGPVGTLGAVAREGHVVRIRDARSHPAYRGLPPQHPSIGSLLGIPIKYQGRSVGNLYLANKRGAAEFSEQDERLVHMLAARAAVAIETAALYEGEALQRAWLQTVIDQMPEAVIFLDYNGKLLLQNRMASALRRDTGRFFAPNCPVPFDVRNPDGTVLPVTELPIARAIRQGVCVVGVELAIVGPNDEWVPVLVSATPIRVGVQISGAVGVFQDISTLKQVERMREEWASIVAHDLRQPVGTIGLSADLLARSLPTGTRGEDLEALERIRSSARRLNRMIDDLLDASRIEASRLSVQPRMTDLGALIDEVVANLHEATSGFPIEVHHGGARAFIDADRIQQVIGNLISNAVKYGERGTTIRIDAIPRDDRVEVVVTNRGRGISSEQLPLLFNRFARTREARNGQAAGLGLGLYISRGLVEAHGGRMWAESVEGRETSFHFTIPRSIPVATPVAAE